MLEGLKGDRNKLKERNIKTQPSYYNNNIIRSKSDPKILNGLKSKESKFLNKSNPHLLDLSASPTKSKNFSIVNSNREVLSMDKIKGRGVLFPFDKHNMNEMRYVGIPNIDYTKEKTCKNIKVICKSNRKINLTSPRSPTD